MVYSDNFDERKIKRRGLMLVLSAPSGTGKTTLAKMLVDTDPHISMSISMTTRKKRPGEIDKVDYHFTNIESFNEMIENREFLEYAEVFGNLYGTPKKTVLGHLENGQDVLFDIDWQGHRQLISRAREDVVGIFILPPSKEELYFRIKKRNQDNTASIHDRIEGVNCELSHWHEYDYIIINDDVQKSENKIKSILYTERLRKARRTGLPDYVLELMEQDISHLLK